MAAERNRLFATVASMMPVNGWIYCLLARVHHKEDTQLLVAANRTARVRLAVVVDVGQNLHGASVLVLAPYSSNQCVGVAAGVRSLTRKLSNDVKALVVVDSRTAGEAADSPDADHSFRCQSVVGDKVHGPWSRDAVARGLDAHSSSQRALVQILVPRN